MIELQSSVLVVVLVYRHPGESILVDIPKVPRLEKIILSSVFAHQ